MSYDTVLSFKINRKNMTITGRYRSSNCFDMFDRRVVEDYTKTYKTPEEFEKGVFDFADGALSGSLRFSSSSTMSKRLTWLSQNNKLRYRYPEKAKSNNPEDAWYKEWFEVERNEETFKVLTGEKKVKPKVWVISDGNGIGVKKTLRYTKLTYSRWTKYYELRYAEEMMEHLKELGWVDQYGLKIREIQLRKTLLKINSLLRGKHHEYTNTIK